MNLKVDMVAEVFNPKHMHTHSIMGTNTNVYIHRHKTGKNTHVYTHKNRDTNTHAQTYKNLYG